MEKRQGLQRTVFKDTVGPTVSPGPVRDHCSLVPSTTGPKSHPCPPEIAWTDTLQGESQSTVDRSCSRGFLREIPGKTKCAVELVLGNEYQNG